MRKEQKQKTSVFSEYQNNENDSISSRQLQFWLKQTAPVSQPRPVNQWTLMSTNSIFEEDEHPLVRNQTFETINKENDMTSFNSARQPINNNSSVLKSKSYLNAMTDLQSKVKQLEQENGNLKNTLRVMKQDRNRSMSESSFFAEQLKYKIALLEPKAKKLEEIVRQNKKLGNWKQENIKKIKIMEKMIKQYEQRMNTYEKQIKRYQQTQIGHSRIHEQSDTKYQQQVKAIEKLKAQNKRVMQKNKELEDMTSKSTTSILQRYNKIVDQNQHFTLDNNLLKTQLAASKQKNDQRLRQISEQYRKQREEIISINQRFKQENIEKKERINALNSQICYFKQQYEKKNEQLIECLKNHSKEMQDAKDRQTELRIKKQYLQTQVTHLEAQKQQIYLSKQSIIKSHANEINNKNQIESQLQIEQFHQIQPQEMEEIPFFETRSAIDKDMRKSIYSKSQIKNQPIDTLSQSNNHNHDVNLVNGPKKTTSKKIKHRSQEIKEKTNQKVKQRSQQKNRSKEKSRQKSRDKSRDIDKNNPGISHEHSFILKSHEPLTHKEVPDQMYYTEQGRYDSANHTKNVPYYWQSNEVADFGISQRGNQNYCNHNPVTSEFTLQQALLNEINREGIRLLQAQLSYMQSDKNDDLTPTEKAEHIGRLKQINQQIRINFEKKMELIQKMNPA